MQEKFLIPVAYLVAINVVTFALYAYDKWCAQNNRWRVRESTLLIFAIIGGSIGAVAAMEIFRHKTLHLKFKFGVPLIFFLQIVLIGVLVMNPEIIFKLFAT